MNFEEAADSIAALVEAGWLVQAVKLIPDINFLAKMGDEFIIGPVGGGHDRGLLCDRLRIVHGIYGVTVPA